VRDGAIAVRAERLVKDYGGAAAPALGGIDLALASGSFTSVMGPSGSGKSTLLHLLGGMDSPTSGEIEIAGIPLASLDDDGLAAVRRQEVGFVFQAYNLVPVLNAAENIALPAVIGREPESSYATRLDEVLAMVGLSEHRTKLPSQMSGGQQQRVAIARALFNRPAVVLADEPTGNLDSVTGAEVLALLRQIVDEVGTTVLMVTHDPRAASYGDEVILLRDGLVAGRLPFPAEATLDIRASGLASWLVDPAAASLIELPAQPRKRRRQPDTRRATETA
jgi:putative ABC transport system ATP-binding protein